MITAVALPDQVPATDIIMTKMVTYKLMMSLVPTQMRVCHLEVIVVFKMNVGGILPVPIQTQLAAAVAMRQDIPALTEPASRIRAAPVTASTAVAGDRPHIRVIMRPEVAR